MYVQKVRRNEDTAKISSGSCSALEQSVMIFDGSSCLPDVCPIDMEARSNDSDLPTVIIYDLVCYSPERRAWSHYGLFYRG
jgi:hypothetical protein